jgi:hypothetical protein
MNLGLGELAVDLSWVVDGAPLTQMAWAMAAKFGLTSALPVSRNPVDFCSSSMKEAISGFRLRSMQYPEPAIVAGSSSVLVR